MPDHYPDDPYPLEEIRSAAQFVLHGTSSAVFENRTDTAQVPTLKTEDVTKFLALINALAPQAQQVVQSRPRPSFAPRPTHPVNSNGDVPNVCAFCGLPGHWKSECLVLEQYIKDGKITKDATNFLVLPSGSRLPTGLQGRSLKERFDEYYRQNPTSSPTTTLMYSLSLSPPESPYAPRSMLTNATIPNMSDLSSEERLVFLEQEVFALRNGKHYDGPDGTL